MMWPVPERMAGPTMCRICDAPIAPGDGDPVYAWWPCRMWCLYVLIEIQFTRPWWALKSWMRRGR